MYQAQTVQPLGSCIAPYMMTNNMPSSFQRPQQCQEVIDVDDVIGRFLTADYMRRVVNKPLQEHEIKMLVNVVRGVFLNQPTLLELEAPLKIMGDIHGHYWDMLKLFELGGSPAQSNYLFLGDYVDRGEQQLATICLLFAFKIKYPERFFLLRGNHECASISRSYGFYDECKKHYNIKLWKSFCDTFNCMPLAAVVQDRIFCMHGGLAPELSDLAQIRKCHRPMELPDTGLVCDLLWADPSEHTNGWTPNSTRGVSVCFGADVVKEFLENQDLDLVVRAHQVVEDGYQFFAERRLVTVFSAPNYCGSFDNAAALLHVDRQLRCSFTCIGGKNAA